ncbi:beta strand repeat-containing protein [Prosthecobacter sp.]|uniref:beta strand repeat-containing protein n=1 Tax=Prosthecobacter sp. TaxID=1965333 RepID=UPI0037845C17
MRIAVCLLGAGMLLLPASLVRAQTATSDPSDPTTSGATITLNNTSGIGLNGTIQLGGTLTLTSGSLSIGTVATAANTTTTNAQQVIDPLSAGGVLTVNSGTVAVASTTTNTLSVIDPLTLGGTLTLANGTGVSTTTATSGTLQVASGLTLTGATTISGINNATIGTAGTFSGTSSLTSSVNLGMLTLSSATTASSIVVNGSTLGTMTSGTLTLNSGGVVDLTSLYASGLNLTMGLISGGSSVLTLATTSSGVSIGIGGTSTTAGSGGVTVTALGSLPAGNTPTSATFTTPAVSLIGVGNLGAQSIAERGVIYSLTSTSSTPTLGGAGVVKVVHTGTATSGGSFSLTAAGLAASTTYTYRVYATDSSGGTYLSQPATFTTPSVLQNWRQTYFGTTKGADHAADNADPDGDGLPNLMEFATGKNPTTAQNTASPGSTSVNAGALEYTYTRSLDAVASGATFTVEWNDTLNPADWSSSGVTESVLADNGVVQQVKATLPASATGRRFVRLTVLPPAQ